MLKSMAVVFLMIFILVSCSQSPDIATEKENIKKAVIDRHEAYKNIDYESFISFWMHESYVSKDWFGSNITVGWDSLQPKFQKWFDKMENDPDQHKIERFDLSDFDISLNGNIAHVFYTVGGKAIYKGEIDTSKAVVLNFLEKQDGQWKIVFETYPGQ